jgi:hypothetical protein
VFFKIDSIDLSLAVKNVDNSMILTPQEGDRVIRNYLLTVGVKFQELAPHSVGGVGTSRDRVLPQIPEDSANRGLQEQDVLFLFCRG